MEDEDSPSNCEDRPVSPEAAEAAAASSLAASSSESGKIFGLDGTASSRKSGSSSATSNSDESTDSDRGGYVEIMLSDTDAKNHAADIKEDEIGEGSDAAAVE
jgi:hypothetical protein